MIKKLAPIALAAVLSATPIVAVATDVTVEIDPGNPYSQTAQPPTENVLVTLTGPVTRSQRTVSGKTTFSELPDGSYKLTFPEQRVFTPGQFELPYIDPVKKKPATQLVVTPKFTPPIIPGVISDIVQKLGIPALGAAIILWLFALGPGAGLLSTGNIPSAQTPPAHALQPTPTPAPSPAPRLTERLRERLASTGADIWWTIAFGSALALAGFMLLIDRRRKERKEQ